MKLNSADQTIQRQNREMNAIKKNLTEKDKDISGFKIKLKES